MKKIAIISISLMGIVCAGCDSTANDAIVAAAKSHNAGEALSILRQAQKEICDSSIGNTCELPKILTDSENKIFLEGARAGDPKILSELFTQSNDIALQKELLPMLLNRAQTSKNSDLLFAAGIAMYLGKARVRNTVMAISLLEEAWNSGNESAPGLLARIYQKMGNTENAYLWSLRCTNSCSRSENIGVGDSAGDIDLNKLEKLLSSDKVAQIQKIAGTNLFNAN